jgi:uncharacterized membrane protein (DUF485 family)
VVRKQGTPSKEAARARGTPMTGDAERLIARVKSDPDFHALVARRSRFAWVLSALMAAIYFGFILLVAFAPDVLGAPISEGVTTVGIPLGIGVILAAFVLTGIYVHRANSEFDALVHSIVERAT